MAEHSPGFRIAIIGMSCRFPGAETCEQYWTNLAAGVESIRRYSREELLAQGAPTDLIDHPSFVPAAPLLSRVGEFDAGLFGFSPREAELLDPQQRLFLECAWESLERAGYDPARTRRPFGVFAGTGVTNYAFENLRAEYTGAGGFEAMLANDKDYVASRIAYKLDLRGPAIAVQTACSTSLVAVHLACQSLLAGECDVALAGAVSIRIPHIGGYVYQPGMIASPDGHCRAFDASAAGTVGGSGAGIVVLKRLDEAIEDHDQILAVIRGSALNNDGALKAGFSAPATATQAAVIREAIAVAGLDPEDISYVEAHGTATPLGDPVEIDALNEAFRSVAQRGGRCALGSVKTNIGHTDTAAGIAGLIKTVLALQHRELPASLHFERPNPEIRFEEGPFEVVSERRYWPSSGPRRAGVSSFGVGGTNAHAVLEEWVSAASRDNDDGPLPIPVSARSRQALQALAGSLSDWLSGNPGTPLSSVALSLATGRRELNWRTFVVARTSHEAADAFRNGMLLIRNNESAQRPVVFLFCGQGAQYPGMARALMCERAFRERVEELGAVFREETGEDLVPLLVDSDSRDEAAGVRLMQTRLAQPALFIVQEALARLWMSWGIQPDALLGHSAGEYTAAALAGILDPSDALRLICRRGTLMQSIAGGAMMAVPASERYLSPYLGTGGLSLAAVNAPGQCVVSGPEEEIEALDRKLRAEGITPVRLRVSVAAQSAMMNPILSSFEREVALVPRRAPRLSVISNVSGQLLTAQEALDPSYWATQLCRTVRFADAIANLRSNADRIFLEMGPGNVLTPLVGDSAFSSLPGAKDARSAADCVTRTLGHLWMHGAHIDWESYHRERGGRRIALPTYPFERHRYWIDGSGADSRKDGRRRLEDWFYLPLWTPSEPAEPAPPGRGFVLIGNETPFRESVARLLEVQGARVQCADSISPGGGLARDTEERHYIVLTPLEGRSGQQAIEACYHTPLRLLRAIVSTNRKQRVTFVSRGAEPVLGGVCESPSAAMLVGLVMAARQELRDITVQSIDLGLKDGAAELIAALSARRPEPSIAWRSGRAWIPTYQRVSPPAAAPRLRRNLVCVITGGVGGIGLGLAHRLARTSQARLALITRSAFPDRDRWQELANDPMFGRRIRRIREIEDAGSAVLILKADVADPVDLRVAINKARGAFGPINGAIHAAGIAGGGLLAVRDHAEADLVLRPKVLGAIGLADALSNDTLDFLVFCGSLTATTGGFGHSDYIAGNAFVDRFAHHLQSRGVPATAIDWDTWNESGMALSPSIPVELRKAWEPSLINGIRDDEGGAVLEYAIGLSLPRVVISTMPLTSRLTASANEVAESLRQVEERRRETPSHPRPDYLSPPQPPGSELEAHICDIFAANLGFSPVSPEDNYFECGGDSLKGISLVSRIEAALGETVHVTAIFEAPSPRQLAAYLEHNYGTAVTRWFHGTERGRDGTEATITADDIQAFRDALPTMPLRTSRPEKKNRRMVFLLSPPRTGSTLLRAMLAGHPDIFAPPELALLSFNTFGERNAAAPEDGGLFDGPLQALRSAMSCDWERAKAEMESFGPSAFIAEFYGHLQNLIGDRLLVDKTPHYVLDPMVLRHAEEDFDQPLYLMLQRHPYGMIRSYVESRIDLLLPAKLRAGSRFTRRQIGELIWLEGYQNMRDFSQTIPLERQHWVRFEDLTENPRATMRGICSFLGIAFDDRVLNPYSDEEKRMTGVLRAGTRPLGDIKFHRYSGIEQSVADRWRDEYAEDFLSDEATALARALGYSLVADLPAAAETRSINEMTDAEVEAELARYFEQNS